MFDYGNDCSHCHVLTRKQDKIMSNFYIKTNLTLITFVTFIEFLASTFSRLFDQQSSDSHVYTSIIYV